MNVTIKVKSQMTLHLEVEKLMNREGASDGATHYGGTFEHPLEKIKRSIPNNGWDKISDPAKYLKEEIRGEA